jgi:hypothetical protein
VSGSRPTHHLEGRVFQLGVDKNDNAFVELATVDLGQVDVVDGELHGTGVVVTCRGVLVDDTPEVGLLGRPMDEIVPIHGRLEFDPRNGGVRTRENRLARGAHNAQLTEAFSFGMVNALHHSTRGLQRMAVWLDELDGGELPRLKVVVGAHSGSRLPGFGQGDGDFRSGKMRPLTGGHYRLSRLTSGIPELDPVAPTGEVHLGPGRRIRPFGEFDSYLHNGAHNPTTIYHELGHHLCRHTADFRVNARRRPDAQRNGKPAVEEGLCDYFAASFIGTGRAFSWYDRRRGVERDLDHPRRLSDVVHTDPHVVGSIWASSWWRVRQALVSNGHIGSAADHDRVMVATLIEIGRTGPVASVRSGRRATAAYRSKSSTVIATYLGVLSEHTTLAGIRLAESVFTEAGLESATEAELGASAC